MTWEYEMDRKEPNGGKCEGVSGLGSEFVATQLAKEKLIRSMV